MYIFKEAETWVAIAFILFVIILIRLGWSKIMQALDKRAEEIKKELDEARNLREQAQSILADYQRKKRDSEKEIFNITDKAKSDTEKNIKVALQNHKDLLERRKKTAEQKITQAQERAIQEIKDFQINDPIYKAGVWDEITISPFNKRVDNLSNSLN